MKVTVRHSGNLLEVSPPMEDVLGKPLGYWHKDFPHGSPVAGKCDELTRYRSKSEAAMARDKEGTRGEFPWFCPVCKGYHLHARPKMEFKWKRVYKITDTGLVTLQGLRSRIFSALSEAGHEVDYQDLRQPSCLEPDYENLRRHMSAEGLRHGQDQILSFVIGRDFGQFEAPTGYGKTAVIGMVVALYSNARIIISSPGTSLLADVYPRLLSITPDVGRMGGGHKDKRRVMLCVDKSLKNLDLDACQLFIADECHKAAAVEASRIVAQIRHAKCFGLSASTKGRPDGTDLRTEALFGPVLYQMDYQEAQALGYVCPIKYAWVHVTDKDGAPSSAGLTTPYQKKLRLYWCNEPRNRKLMQAAAQLPVRLGMGPDQQVLVIVDTLTHAYALQKMAPDYRVIYAEKDRASWAELKRKGVVPPDEVRMEPRDREVYRREFGEGTLRRVICTPTWATGMNFTHLSVLVHASGAASPISNVQWPGRVTRKGKALGLIIDSRDEWDPWTKQRSNERRRVYRKKGWEEVDADPNAGEYEQMSLLRHDD